MNRLGLVTGAHTLGEHPDDRPANKEALPSEETLAAENDYVVAEEHEEQEAEDPSTLRLPDDLG